MVFKGQRKMEVERRKGGRVSGEGMGMGDEGVERVRGLVGEGGWGGRR